MSKLRSLFTACLFLYSVLCHAGLAASQEPLVAPAKSAPAKSQIALIDLKYIFDHYDRFQQEEEKVSEVAKLADAVVRLRKASIDKLKKDLAKATPGTQLHAELEQTAARKELELRAFVLQQKKVVLLRSAKMRFDVHREVVAEVERYMAEKQILVVLRYNRQRPTNDNDVREVAQFLNNPVVACNSKIDITQAILDRVRAKHRVRMTGRTKK